MYMNIKMKYFRHKFMIFTLRNNTISSNEVLVLNIRKRLLLVNDVSNRKYNFRAPKVIDSYSLIDNTHIHTHIYIYKTL